MVILNCLCTCIHVQYMYVYSMSVCLSIHVCLCVSYKYMYMYVYSMYVYLTQLFCQGLSNNCIPTIAFVFAFWFSVSKCLYLVFNVVDVIISPLFVITFLCLNCGDYNFCVL